MSVRVRIYGGLGNQLFQFAAALLVAKKRGLSICDIFVDARSVGSYRASRDFLLEEIGIGDWIQPVNSWVLQYRLAKVFGGLVGNDVLITDRNFKSEQVALLFKAAYLDGYFQHGWAQTEFEACAKLLVRLAAREKKELRSDCVIHVRGGDFVSLGWNSVSSRSFYEDSISTMKAKFGVSRFLVVSDDLKYARSLFDGVNEDLIFQAGSTMLADFDTIASFRYRILSSSTFCFWASVFGWEGTEAVFAPAEYKPGVIRDIRLPGEVIEGDVYRW